MRIGIFGGSFDPIHIGHLILAEHCREQADLDQVWFIPSATNPHKQDGASASDKQRAEMVRLAIGGHAGFVFSAIEMERGGVSYTVDTLRQLSDDHGPEELFLLMGADSSADFQTWRDPEQICALAIPLVVGRPGEGPVNLDEFSRFVDEERLATFKQFSIVSPLIDISSTDIRSRVGNERSIRYLMPRSVEKYIETQRVYRSKNK